MNVYRVILLVAVSVFFISGLVMTGAEQKAQDRKSVEPDTPTDLVAGMETDKQLKRSKIFRQPAKARSLLGRVDRDVTALIGEPMRDLSNKHGESLPSQGGYLKEMACASSVILLGRVLEKVSLFSEDRKSIFTDYQVETIDVFRNTPKLSIKSGSEVTITRSGGVVRFNGRVYRVLDKSYDILPVGESFLFFLNYVEDSDSLLPSSTEATFKLKDSQFERFSATQPKYLITSEYPVDAFIFSISNALNDCSMEGD